MNDQLQTTLTEKLKSGWQSNPALTTLIDDYTKYHTVLVITGGLVLLIFVLLTIVFWMKFKKIPKVSRFRWSFDKKVYFSFGIVLTVFSLFFALVVAVNLSTVLNPLPGFILAASSVSTPSNSIDGQALNEWVQSGSSTFPPVLQQKIQDRINWQRPKAIICGVMLAIFVGITVRIWNYLIKAARAHEVKWHLKEKPSFVVGIVTVALSLLMLVMVIANMQGAIAPVAISLLGV